MAEKGVHELFAATSPFEMVQLLWVRAISKMTSVGLSTRRFDLGKVVSEILGVSRKVMFVDVSQAHLYALIKVDVDAYVDLPPECSQQGVCGKLNHWFSGMRLASKE